ncbi:MAG TPA: hypothetical protein VNP73_09050 [Actinomycetota bacterium]|nr:hypothetical protein [Actinomycetota bacterium]
MNLRSLWVVAFAALIAVQALPARGQAPGVPAQVVDYEPPSSIEKFKVTNFGPSASPSDDKTTKAKFRVVERTGNCCENYLTATPEGRLLDLGGSYINFTDDDGKTWKSVRPANPLVNGEGTLAVAPNDDIVGIEWDPYSADHMLAYKYTAETKEWTYLEAPLKTPFYDRPWLSVVPGPFTINGAEVPYVTFVDGFPHTGAFLYSTDGLTYVQGSSPFVDQQGGAEVVNKLATGKEPALDWVQPNTQSPIVPLGGGSALAAPGAFQEAWNIFDPETQKWNSLQLDTGELSGRYLVDSKGRIHNLKTLGQMLEYRISTDGARTWKSTTIQLPKDHSSPGGMMVDMRANASLGIAAIALHVSTGETDGDLLYKFDITGKKPRPISVVHVGLADIDASAGVGQDIRMDFETLAILPDGRLVVSFLDSTTGPVMHLQEPIAERLGPAIAIEL